jgi:hypothetical protein
MTPKRPRDPNQLAKSIIDIATGEKPDRASPRQRSHPKVSRVNQDSRRLQDRSPRRREAKLGALVRSEVHQPMQHSPALSSA